MARRDIKGDILRYHRDRWLEEFRSPMKVAFGEAKRLIGLLLQENSEADILDGIEILFDMHSEGALGDEPPDVRQLSYRWNVITLRKQKRDEWGKHQTKA